MIRQQGFTLMEMMVTLAILSIMAGLTIPYAELMITRQKEYELRDNLRDIRDAIDRFHADWEQGKLQNDPDSVSKYGYPANLQVLVDGVTSSKISGEIYKYLRKIPTDPFLNDTDLLEHHWQYIGYQDRADTEEWNGEDIYDIRSFSDKQAIDKSYYSEW